MPISPRWGLPPGRALDCAAVALLIAVAAIVALTFRDYGLGWDDYTHAQYGDLLLRLYGSGFADRRALSFVNLYAYGGGFDMVAALLAKILPFDLFETRRLAGAAGRPRRARGDLAARPPRRRPARRPDRARAHRHLPALLRAHVHEPEGRAVRRRDGAVLLGLVRALEEYPTPQRATGALAGVGLGLAIGTRILGGFAVLYAIVAAGRDPRDRGPPPGRTAGRDARSADSCCACCRGWCWPMP